MIPLRDYQHQAIAQLRQGWRDGHMRQVVAAPTGSGKTVLAAALSKLSSLRGRQAWFLCDRTSLIAQTVRSFSNLGLSVGVVWRDRGDFRGDEDVVVASTQTLAARYRSSKKLPSSCGLVIIDEVHVLHRFHIELMSRWDAIPVIGLSATPMRKGLGLHFTNLCRGPSIRELTLQGFLAPFRCFGPSEPDLTGVKVRQGDYCENDLADRLDKAEIIGDLVSHWERLAEQRPTIVFCINIAHSKSVVQGFLDAQHIAVHIDCHTAEDERERIFSAFRSGEIRILSSVAVLALGFDMPATGCVVMARPTLSKALYIQQAGRGTRLAAGKVDCVLLDHAGNVARFGLPDTFVVPPLCVASGKTRPAKKKRSERQAAPCLDCGFMLLPTDRECSECGFSKSSKSLIEHTDAQLVSLDGHDHRHVADDPQTIYLELLHYAQARNWSSGWAYHKFIDRYRTTPNPAWKWLAPIPASAATLRWITARAIRYAKRKQRAIA